MRGQNQNQNEGAGPYLNEKSASGVIDYSYFTGGVTFPINSLRMPRTVNGTGHTGPSEFCATSI